jgi:hypothetical protein
MLDEVVSRGSASSSAWAANDDSDVNCRWMEINNMNKDQNLQNKNEVVK